MLLIGIDPGAKTGVAVWDAGSKRFSSILTTDILGAMECVMQVREAGAPIAIRFEDARRRKGGFERTDKAEAEHGAGVREGVGAVKAECRIWEAFCRRHAIPFEAVPPAQAVTKLDAGRFAAMTGWSRPTSQHARDAAMLVFSRTHAPADGSAKCARCAHVLADHLPGTHNCPRGPRGPAGFASYTAATFHPQGKR